MPRAALSNWFESEAPDSPYRVLVHARSYRYPEATRHHEFWDTRMYLEPHNRTLDPERFHALVSQAEKFLLPVASAYDKGHEAVEEVFRQSGHAYSCSSGQRPGN